MDSIMVNLLMKVRIVILRVVIVILTFVDD